MGPPSQRGAVYRSGIDSEDPRLGRCSGMTPEPA
jgi:hypothetical protein